MTVAGDAMVPTSPQPFTPSGLCVHGVMCVSTSTRGTWSARGMQ